MNIYIEKKNKINKIGLFNNKNKEKEKYEDNSNNNNLVSVNLAN